MSSRVRKRPLGWRRQDPVGGGPQREIQITEHACSKSAVYPLWTRAFNPSPPPPTLKQPVSISERAAFVSGEDLASPHDGVLNSAPWRLRLDPQLEVLGPVVIPHAVAMVNGFTR